MKQRKLLTFFAILFVLVVIAFAVDFMRKSTRPGLKKQLPTRLMR